jgi:hypothetical protein
VPLLDHARLLANPCVRCPSGKSVNVRLAIRQVQRSARGQRRRHRFGHRLPPVIRVVHVTRLHGLGHQAAITTPCRLACQGVDWMCWTEDAAGRQAATGAGRTRGQWVVPLAAPLLFRVDPLQSVTRFEGRSVFTKGSTRTLRTLSHL